MMLVPEKERLFRTNYLSLSHYRQQSMGGVLNSITKFSASDGLKIWI